MSNTIPQDEFSQKNAPVYLNTASYASEHDGLEQYRASYKVNTACKEAIEKAINDHYSDNRLSDAAAKTVLEKFGKDRVLYVLANTIRHKPWDGRISNDNRQWANSIFITDEPNSRYFAADKVHPGLLDLFTTQIRSGNERSSVLDKLKNPAAQKPKSPQPVRREER